VYSSKAPVRSLFKITSLNALISVSSCLVMRRLMSFQAISSIVFSRYLARCHHPPGRDCLAIAAAMAACPASVGWKPSPASARSLARARSRRFAIPPFGVE
jgi:hypothetical protein